MTLDWNMLDVKWRRKWEESNDFESDPYEKEKKFIT